MFPFVLVGTILKITGEVAMTAGFGYMMVESGKKVTTKLVENWIEKTEAKAEELEKEEQKKK